MVIVLKKDISIEEKHNLANFLGENNFKTNEVIFGGGRLKGISKTSIPLSWEALMEVYDEANSGKSEKTETKVEDKPTRRSRHKVEETENETSSEDKTDEVKDDVVNETPTANTSKEETTEEKPRTRRSRATKEETPKEEDKSEEEKPRTRRTRRSAREE